MPGTLSLDENRGGQIDVEVEPLEGVPWQYRDYHSVFDGQYRNELPPHRSFDHAIDMVEGKNHPGDLSMHCRRRRWRF